MESMAVVELNTRKTQWKEKGRDESRNNEAHIRINGWMMLGGNLAPAIKLDRDDVFPLLDPSVFIFHSFLSFESDRFSPRAPLFCYSPGDSFDAKKIQDSECMNDSGLPIISKDPGV